MAAAFQVIKIKVNILKVKIIYFLAKEKYAKKVKILLININKNLNVKMTLI